MFFALMSAAESVSAHLQSLKRDVFSKAVKVRQVSDALFLEKINNSHSAFTQKPLGVGTATGNPNKQLITLLHMYTTRCDINTL